MLSWLQESDLIHKHKRNFQYIWGSTFHFVLMVWETLAINLFKTFTKKSLAKWQVSGGFCFTTVEQNREFASFAHTDIHFVERKVISGP